MFCLRIVLCVFLFVGMLGACSTTADFPEIVDENSEEVVSSAEVVPVEQTAEVGEKAKEVEVESAAEPKAEKVAAASVKPIFRGDNADLIADESALPTMAETPLADDLLLDVDTEPATSKTAELVVEKTANTELVPAESFAENIKIAPSVNYCAQTVYFDNLSSSLSAEDKNNLQKVAEVAKDNDALVNVIGHSSARTSNMNAKKHKMVNFEVAWKRTQNVVKALKKLGVSADKISFEVLADNKPAYLEVMPEGERLNRRVEVYLSY